MFKLLKSKLRIFHEKTEEELKKETISYKLKAGKLEELLSSLELILLEADVAFSVIEKIKDDLKRELTSKRFSRNKNIVRDSLKTIVSNILSSVERNFEDVITTKDRPIKLLFVGVNGSGKTSAIAKLAWRLMQKNYSCVFAASDTFRAGAIEQLEKHAEKLGVRIIKQFPGSDPAAVAYDAVEHAKAKKKDFVFVDTAGRMQTNINLMEEMKKLKRVIKPDFIIFVGDALTGNDAVEQARTFNDALGIDGVILTKIDADAKGGAALSIAYTIRKPIFFLSTGQAYDNIIPFDAKWLVERLFE
jgi:fused signal recognition particle receptor